MSDTANPALSPTATRGGAPKISVVIPTYNRCELLRQTLRQLTTQDIAPHEFEVIVSDDGSTDATRAVVSSFVRELRVKYHYQEDLGFRAASARNAGARLASAPILAFLDTGALVGPGYVRNHLAAHCDSAPHRAVAGYAYAYNPNSQTNHLDEALSRMSPEQLLASYGDDPEIQDVRHAALSKCNFDLSRRCVPWLLFWSLNCSVRADDFWAVGGFGEEFRGWGLEDMELGFRLRRHGVSMYFTRDAWAIHAPHERDKDTERQQLRVNVTRFLAMHPEPAIEIGWTLITRHNLVWPWEDDYRDLRTLTGEVSELDVADELAEVGRVIPAGHRIAIFGSGGHIPAGMSPAAVVDFDETLLGRAARTTGAPGHHAIGLRTPLADQSVDTVIITSRLRGLWPRWGADVLAEAQRIGSHVHTFADAEETSRQQDRPEPPAQDTAGPQPSGVRDLAAMRTVLDQVDERLLDLIGQRITCCVDIAQFKRDNGVPMMQPHRIGLVQGRASRYGEEHGIDPDFLGRLYEVIIAETCRVEDLVITGGGAG